MQPFTQANPHQSNPNPPTTTTHGTPQIPKYYYDEQKTADGQQLHLLKSATEHDSHWVTIYDVTTRKDSEGKVVFVRCSQGEFAVVPHGNEEEDNKADILSPSAANSPHTPRLNAKSSQAAVAVVSADGKSDGNKSGKQDTSKKPTVEVETVDISGDEEEEEDLYCKYLLDSWNRISQVKPPGTVHWKVIKDPKIRCDKAGHWIGFSDGDSGLIYTVPPNSPVPLGHVRLGGNLKSPPAPTAGPKQAYVPTRKQMEDAERLFEDTGMVDPVVVKVVFVDRGLFSDSKEGYMETPLFIKNIISSFKTRELDNFSKKKIPTIVTVFTIFDTYAYYFCDKPADAFVVSRCTPGKTVGMKVVEGFGIMMANFTKRANLFSLFELIAPLVFPLKNSFGIFILNAKAIMDADCEGLEYNDVAAKKNGKYNTLVDFKKFRQDSHSEKDSRVFERELVPQLKFFSAYSTTTNMTYTMDAETAGSWSNNGLVKASYYTKADHIVGKMRTMGVYDPEYLKENKIKVMTLHTKARSLAQVHQGIDINDVEFCCHHVPMFLKCMGKLDFSKVNADDDKWRELTSKIRADLRKEGMQCHHVGKTPLPWQSLNNNDINPDAKTGKNKREATVAMPNNDKTAEVSGPNKRHNSSTTKTSETTGEQGVQHEQGGFVGKLVAATKGACLGAYNGFAGNSNSKSS
jgi:hypothetical protein